MNEFLSDDTLDTLTASMKRLSTARTAQGLTAPSSGSPSPTTINPPSKLWDCGSPRSIRSRRTSCASVTASPTKPSFSVPGISSRISTSHGISTERLKLFSANPPETRFTNLAYTSKDGDANAVIVDLDTGVRVERHPDLWFEDGSVICRAENTLFCVHMSQLARHSLCFHDMFMLPQPESKLESSLTINSSQGGHTETRKIPVVYLYDNAEDVGNLLTALYDGPNFGTFGNNDEADFRVVSGCLRLSTKYLIDSLREKAIAHLSKAWPSDLKTWDAREDLARSYETDGPTKSSRFPHPFAIINLAREVNAPSLLPSAFYDLSRYSFAQILEPNEDDILYREKPQLRLLPTDMQRLCLGKEASQQMVTSLIQSMGNGHIRHSQQHPGHSHSRKSSGSGICVSAAACRKDFMELVDLATQHYLYDRERGCYDPLYVAEELGQLKSAEFSECKSCAKSLESWAAREREKIWKMIPSWFRLESSADIPPTSS
ncbi:hypothetical protein CVT24_001516 [Panaeolus cyanescens]|uniref:BTB domain-containing protein n=1 Tax=Panaeolus cyanescens TaxID=181874 RepID=A0A409YFB4_9AGAR|nr:hypothetical protein CVT24_001516 [Panaeolus cyanescens]